MEDIMKAIRWFLVAAAVVLLGLQGCSVFNPPVASVSVLGEVQYANDFAMSGQFRLATLPVGLDGNIIGLNDPASVLIGIDSTIPPSQVYSVSVSQVTFDNPISGNQAFAILFDGGTGMATADPYRNRVENTKSFIRVIGGWNPANVVAIADFGIGFDSDYYFRMLQGFVPATETLSLFPSLGLLADTGRTPLYSSLMRCLAYTDTAAPATGFSRQLLLFAAGRDSTSLPDDDLAAVIASATAKGIKVNVIGVGTGVDDASLGALAGATQGLYFHADDLNEAVSALGLGLQHGYDAVTASFSPVPPPGTVGDGHLTIDAARSASSSLRFRIP
jgi:hypothetical protein